VAQPAPPTGGGGPNAASVCSIWLFPTHIEVKIKGVGMASERLSKLQMAILDSISGDRLVLPRGELILADVGRRLRRKGTAFDISFSRSMKSLEDKGLLRDARSWDSPQVAKWQDKTYRITSRGHVLLLREHCGVGFGYLRQMVNSLGEDEALNVLRELGESS